MKVEGHGQAAIISDGDYAKIRKAISSRKYKMLLDLARYTGERWGALIQLRVEDVFDESGPREYITFRASTRKASPSGQRRTRSCPVNPELSSLLAAYPRPESVMLFESRNNPGHSICLRAADLVFRNAVEKAGLGHKGISTHSTRRTFITTLYERGVDLLLIQQLTGHEDIKSMLRYVEKDPQRLKEAIALL